MWSAVASSGIQLAGTLIGGAISARNVDKQMEMQREFAQNGVRWKVADAKAAGIHPLAALGAQTFSYNPVMTGDNGVSEALSRMGQGIDRAAHAKALQEERILDSELKRAQIRNVNAQTDAVQAQAVASKAALAKSAQVPPMPQINGKNVNAPVNKFVWAKNPDGKVELLPSEDFVNAYEDKPLGMDLIPLLEAGARSLYGKFTGEPIDNRRWSWSDRDWIPVDKSVSSRPKRQVKISDYYFNSHRY